MREKGIDKIEAHVAGACVANGLGPVQVLALQRADSRQLYPGCWEGIGGQVKAGQSFEQAAATHLRDEAGIEGEVVCPYTTYTIPPKDGVQEVIPGVRFLIKVSQECQVSIDPDQHKNWAWIEEGELDTVRWIPGLREQLAEGIELYKDLHFRGII